MLLRLLVLEEYVSVLVAIVPVWWLHHAVAEIKLLILSALHCISINSLRGILLPSVYLHLLELLGVALSHKLRVLLHLLHVALQVHLLQSLVLLVVNHALAVVRLVLSVLLLGRVHNLVGVV